MGRATKAVPALLRRHGYQTACIGKWHLGMEISESPDVLGNQARADPARVKRLLALLQLLADEGRSTPGARQTNDTAVDLWKWETMPGMDPERAKPYIGDPQTRKTTP